MRMLKLLLVIEISAVSAWAQPCPVGYYSTNGNVPCVPAPPGYYVSVEGATNPTSATPGNYVSGFAATNQTAAVAGAYCPVSNMSLAILAAPGFYVPATGASNETPADPGFYVSFYGATNETGASPGRYCPVAGMSNALTASPGYYVSTSNSASQTPAPPGYYEPFSGASNALPAPPGSYVPGYAATVATLASPGYFVTESAASNQTPALAGSYVPGYGAWNATFASPGFYCPASGMSNELPATPGYYVSSQGAYAQTPASPGFYVAETGASNQTPAGVGSYVPGYAATQATLASPGYYVPFTGASNQTPAPPGHYVPTAGAFLATAASLGFYCPVSCMSNELPASPGYYVSVIGASNQIPASPGYYVSVSGATNQTPAPPGYYCPVAAMIAPIPASPGYYVPTNGATNELPAPVGYYTSNSAASNVLAAPAGTYAPVAGMQGVVVPSDVISNAAASGVLQVTILPTNAVAAGAQWQIDGGAQQQSGVSVSNLLVGAHTVSFAPVPGWTPPPDQIVTISNGVTTAITNTYTGSVATGSLVLVTNGVGTIDLQSLPVAPVVGAIYQIKAIAGAGYVFVDWIGGTNPPYSVLSTNAAYTFVMQSNLLLEAHFVTNLVAPAQGAYFGLFAPAGARAQTNSGSFTFNLTKTGEVSGKLVLGSEKVSLSGKFDAYGSAVIRATPPGANTLTVTLQLNPGSQAVAGTVSDGSFVAQLLGYQSVFGPRNPAASAGLYTLIISGATNPAVGPAGASYATLKISSTGTIAASGSLADGTPVTLSSMLSSGGYWPLYVNLYNGRGSLWGWASVNSNLVAASGALSWINAGNTSKTASDTSGFTNLQATLIGSLYNPATGLPQGPATVTLTGAGLTLTNNITVGSDDKISTTNATGLKLSIAHATGIISGTFANPTNSRDSIKVSGVILQSQTNAQGYFLNNAQSGAFELTPQ